MVALYGLLTARLFYFSCLLPQIWLTYKLKKGTALSDLFLLGYLNGYMTFLIYIFCYNLPMAYQIIAPLETVAVLIMIAQRLYYDRALNRPKIKPENKTAHGEPVEPHERSYPSTSSGRADFRFYLAELATAPRSLHLLYAANTVLFLAFIPWALRAPLQCGYVFGWLTFAISAVNQLPQVVKIFKEKSVQGFSFMFVLLVGAATVVEFCSAVALSLPIQTTANALRGIIIFLIFCVQFFLYRR